MVELGKRTLVIDLDGVIATGTVEEVYSEEAGWAYEKCTLIEGAKEGLEELSKKYKLILSTARLEVDTEKTIEWLEKHEILKYFDEVHIGKKSPAIAYIDDKAVRFNGWEEVLKCF